MTDLNRLPVAEGVRRRLQSALGRLSHAYIISGASRGETTAVAEFLAAALVCSGQGQRPCGLCSHCRKVDGGIHPDVIRVSIPEDKRSISVDQIRTMRADAYVRPNEADRKVFIIEDAQTMKDEAQNALLKVLEDGPSYAAFLLLTEHPQQLLATIRSRCEQLSLTAQTSERAAKLDAEQRQSAHDLVRLLLSREQNELALAEAAVALERKKWEKDILLAILDEVEEALRTQLSAHPARVLPVLERLRTVRAATTFHIGTGHLFGWLVTGS